MIRYKDVRGEELDKAIATLIKDLENAKKSARSDSE